LEKITMPLKERIALRMKELGLTQMKLAQRSRLTQQAISKYIRGKSKPGYDAIVTLSGALEVNPAWFFEEESESNVSSSDVWPRQDNRIVAPGPTSGDVIVFPTSGRVLKGARFVIGHWLPMKDFPAPTRVVSHGVMTNFYELIFNKLVQLIPPGQLRGGLARDWKPVGNSWVFQLRDGVKFHNGKPFSAEDVIWSYEQYLQHTPSDQLLEGLELLDQDFIQIHLKSPCRLEELPMPFILPAGLEGNTENWIGTGPFQAVQLASGFWQLKKNPRFFIFQPFFDEIHIREYPNPQALEQALASGETHFAIGVYAPGEHFIAKSEPAALRYHLLFMVDQPVVQDVIVRQAISLGMDRELLAKAAGLKEPLYSSGPFDYALDDRQHQPPFPQKEVAIQLLKQIPGLQNFTFRVKYYETDPQSRLLAQAIVEQLRGLGVSAEIGEPPSAVLVHRPVERLDREYSFWATSGPYNLSRYSNPQVDQRIRQLRSATPAPSQLLELRRLILRDSPDIPLFYSEMPITYVKQLRALENRVILFSCLGEIHAWYLDADIERQKNREAHLASLG
jgi:peptide/nickel transport system substrate-binding protein